MEVPVDHLRRWAVNRGKCPTAVAAASKWYGDFASFHCTFWRHWRLSLFDGHRILHRDRVVERKSFIFNRINEPNST